MPISRFRKRCLLTSSSSPSQISEGSRHCLTLKLTGSDGTSSETWRAEETRNTKLLSESSLPIHLDVEMASGNLVI